MGGRLRWCYFPIGLGQGLYTGTFLEDWLIRVRDISPSEQSICTRFHSFHDSYTILLP